MKGRVDDKYSKITDEQYTFHFGLNNPEKKDLHKEAFVRAWETRNFEIDKFWQRSAYFWGFIILIFGGYVTVVTGEFSQTAKEMYLDFYFTLLGLIFSFAWILVIRGSKRWQENWEKHIDYLEDKITGPLYKTLYYRGEKYYSVSKINLILARVVFVTWWFLLLRYFFTNCSVIEDIHYLKTFVLLVLPLLGMFFCMYVLCKAGQTDGGKFNKELKKKLEKNEHGAFFVKKLGN
jgi:hypothetical protein